MDSAGGEGRERKKKKKRRGRNRKETSSEDENSLLGEFPAVERGELFPNLRTRPAKAADKKENVSQR